MTYLQIHELQDGRYLRLRLTGELDIGSAPVLKRRLDRLQTEKRPVRLDLSGLEFMDSSGLQLLVSAIGNARADGQAFEIQPTLSPQVERLFEITNLGILIGRPSLTRR